MAMDKHQTQDKHLSLLTGESIRILDLRTFPISHLVASAFFKLP